MSRVEKGAAAIELKTLSRIPASGAEAFDRKKMSA
jgi:hypothetical protein